jgi:hypothetical protein
MKDPVNGSQVLDSLVLFLRDHVRLRDDEYSVLAVWLLHCHAWPAWTRTPYLHVFSATELCGKTLLLELLQMLLPNGRLLASMSSEALLARVIERDHPPLLLDEIDKLKRGNKEMFAAVMAVINSGYKKSGCRDILVPCKGGWEAKALSTFCPKVLAGISDLPADTTSRCIPIAMERMFHEDRVQEIDEYITGPRANELFNRAADWAKPNLKRLRDARPDAPAALGHRQREVSRPLLAVADAVGDGWGERIRGALVRLFASRDALPSLNIRIQLLHDLLDVFGDGQKLASEYLATELGKIEASPWSAWGKSQRPINQTQLAWEMKDFRVFPKSQRNDDGTNRKGYDRADFEPLWKRYPKNPPSPTSTPHSSRHTVTSPINIDDFAFPERHKKENVTAEKLEIANKDACCDGVSPKPGGNGQGCYVHGAKTEWWTRPDGEMVCNRCHPSPKGRTQ